MMNPAIYTLLRTDDDLTPLILRAILATIMFLHGPKKGVGQLVFFREMAKPQDGNLVRHVVVAQLQAHGPAHRMELLGRLATPLRWSL